MTERTAAEQLDLAKSLVKPYSLYDLRYLPKPVRNEKLRALRAAGIPIRDIERYTGIGRGIISRT